ncbi:TonB-dependent receptor [Luteibacter aegosomatis]|uniref:TonB-dependent receptor n=1 Tax=Luteibacter aegosomatis TaxID=2911537 RepID=UPI001FF70AD5|nr:TonB-dependent receptor [Luteibacter aegosomatis]UPG85550.1 TonB-dependent receptor [Luteibacter aegosomatis]
MSSRSILQASALRRSALAVALAVGLGGTGAVLAQSTSGTIFGQATPGQTVTVTSTSGVTRTVTVDQSGRYTVSNLPVGTYNVSLMADGATVSTRENVGIRVGSGTEVSFANAAATAGNAQDLSGVTVSANALPSIDVTGVDSRTVITSQQLQRLPLARSADAIAQLAPGVVAGSSDFTSQATGKPLSSFGGAGVSENAYYINGMNVTDPLNGLGGIELPYGSIEQQEVLTGGYGAAYGRSDGGVINQIGKRGTNEWHFGAQVLYTPEWARATPRSTYYGEAFPGGSLNGTLYQNRSANKGWEAVESAYVGGPLIKDKLFMFASVEGDRTEDKYTSVSSSAAQQTKRTFKDPKWYAKLDWNITDNHILELTGASTKHEYSGQNYAYDYDNFQRGDYLGADVATKTSARMWIAKYTGYITDDFTISAQYGKQKTDIWQDPINDYADLIPILSSTKQNPALNGGTPITNANKVLHITDPSHQTRGANYRIDLTYKLGDHTITAGIDNQRTQDINDSSLMAPNAGYAWQYGIQTNPASEIADGEVDAPINYPGGENGYFVDKYVQSTSASTRVEQRAQYIEDSWQVNDRWLVKLGLRNDQFTNYNPDGQAYIRQTRPQWAPRLGFSWDVFGDSSLKVYGNAGRYYLALPTSVALRGAAGSLYTQTFYTYTGIDANGYPTGLTPINTSNGPGTPYSANREFGQAPDPNTVTAKNLKAQSQNEYILGFDKALNDKYNVGMKATFRRLNRAIDDVCDTDVFEEQATLQGADLSGLRGCYFFNPGSAATFQLPNAAGGYQQVEITNADFGFPHVKRKYYALDTYIEHPFDGTWWGKITYTFSKSYGNSEGQVKSDIGQQDIAATQDWDFPSIMEYGSGRLPNDHRHQVKAYGSWQINPEWNLSGILTVASGAPTSCEGLYGPNQTVPAYNGNYYHWCNGVPAPYGTAGDTPWTRIVSLNAEYRPSFADHKLAFNVNVYNIFNEQRPTRLDPDYSNGNYRTPSSWETPRYVRFGITYDF